MDELAQDLASALEESELKQDIDDPGDMSATSTRLDKELYRKRRTRKRRTVSSTSSHLVSSLLNNLVVVKQINNSPRSSSSLDEAVKDYVESLTANCSDESDEYVNTLKHRLKNAVLSSNLQDRGHHRRVFKQATPCCCESDSYTENGSALPVLRRHRKKKIKRMTIDSNSKLEDGTYQLSNGQEETVEAKKKKKFPPKGGPRTSPPVETEKMSCKTTKFKKERKLLVACLLCSQKSCNKSQDSFTVNSQSASMTKDDKLPSSLKEMNSKEDNYILDCRCRCHSTSVKDESSISSTSSNSDTDSANFTQDDVGGEGDDEMTDFYAESENGPVWGVPNICGMPWWARRQFIRNSKGEPVMLQEMEESDMTSATHIYDPRVRRFVNGSWHLSDCSRKGYHARNNRLPGMAARSIRRGRRRTKMKKSTKEKGTREQELLEFHSSLSKLSLSARTKRRKLEDSAWRDAHVSRTEWSSNKVFQSIPMAESSSSSKANLEVNFTEKKSQTHESNAGTSSTTPTNLRENENL